MANLLTQQPFFLDTDQTTSYWNTVGILKNGGSLFITKILITCPGGTVTGGTITVSDGATTPINLLIIPVVSTVRLPLELNFNSAALTWRDFKITGLTATGCAVQIWYR